MKTLFKCFSDSAKEFGNLRSVVTVALLVALHTVMALFLSIQVTTSLRISISFLANVMVGCMFGPVMGFVAGGLGDVIQFVIKPTGPYFIGWTISAALAGLIYGCFFYGKTPKIFEKNSQARIKNQTDLENSLKKIDVNTRLEGILNVGSALLSAISIGLLIAAPFLEVIIKGTDGSKSTVHGSASYYIFSGNGSTNTRIAAIFIAVVCVILFILPWIKWYKTALTVSVIGTFLLILAVYTDKKTTSPLMGFWCVVALLIGYMVIQLVQIAKKHSMDFAFLVRCIIALTFDTVLINILLGTYWVSFMYGKGFAFYFTTRLIKNLVQLPINIMLTYYVLGMVKKIRIHK